jgi:hypothetical protein
VGIPAPGPGRLRGRRGHYAARRLAVLAGYQFVLDAAVRMDSIAGQAVRGAGTSARIVALPALGELGLAWISGEHLLRTGPLFRQS